MVASVTTKKPIHDGCAKCTTQINDLCVWNFVHNDAIELQPGGHSFPFTFLLPGHLPASTAGSLSAISYALVGRAVPVTGKELTLFLPLTVQRSIHASNDKEIVQIFPPTNLTANITMPPVVRPIGMFNVQLRLDGVVSQARGNQIHWKLRRCTWRLEEMQVVVSPACAKHAAKLGNDGKGILHSETHVLGRGILENGWKIDFSSGDGRIGMEFVVSINENVTPLCDVEASEITVSHALVIELIIYEECPQSNMPTGNMLALKMQFNIVVAEREEGLGISWDEEPPPIYGNIPASPPIYTIY
jgi:hypothetical protein